MTIKNLFLKGLFFCLILISGCKSSIDENKAKELIVQTFKLPYSVNKTLVTGDYPIRDGDQYQQPILSKFDISGYLFLINSGYMNITPRIQPFPGAYPGFGTMVFNLQFTDKAKPLIINSSTAENQTVNNLVKLTLIEFGKILTLRQITDNEYEAEFSLNETTTPMGNAYKMGVLRPRQEKYFNDVFQNLKVKIYKYDNGWAIATDDISRIQEMLD